MICDYNLDNMYYTFIYDDKVTKKQLTNLGFTEYDINNMIKNNIIKTNDNNYYYCSCVDNLFLYAKKLIKQKNYDEATKCLEKCHKIDSKHMATNFQLFLRSIKREDYNSALEYLDGFFEEKNVFYKRDMNVYLYLLSMIITLPKKYSDYLEKLEIDDYMVDKNDKRYRNVNFQNDIRLLIINQSFSKAIKALQNYKKISGNLNVQELLIELLMYKASKQRSKYTNEILMLINQDKYEDAIKYLDEIKKQHMLNKYDEYALKLLKELVNIRDKNEIPLSLVYNINDIFSAIDGKNYELALSLFKNFKSNVENNIMYALLKKINTQINNIKNSPAKTEIPKELSEKIEQLNDKNIVLIDDVSLDMASNIIEVFSKNPKVVAGLVDNDELKHIVLVRRLDKFNDLDKKMLFKLAKDSYEKGNYNLSIEYYLKLIEYDCKKAFLYAKLAMAYIKNSDKENAINCLIIANKLNEKYDYTELIASLKGLVRLKDKKPRFFMPIDEFEDDLDNYYDINCVEGVARLVNDGYLFDEACDYYNIPEEEKGLILLIFAREYYAQSNDSLANEFIKRYEKQGVKTHEAKALYKEIMGKRRFYKNRINNHKALLCLTQKN